jgi:hypothetical protein
MLWLLPIMMVYAASVNSQGTLLLTVARVSLRLHHILLLVEGRAVGAINPETIRPGHLQPVVAKSPMSRLKKLGRLQKS